MFDAGGQRSKFVRMPVRAKSIAMIPVVAALMSCGDPDARLIGKVESPDGKRELSLYYVVPGSILDEYLVLNVAPRGEPYAPDDSVATFAKANDLRAYWAADGRPVIVVKAMDGGIRERVPELSVCVGNEVKCVKPNPGGQHLAVRAFETGGSPPR